MEKWNKELIEKLWSKYQGGKREIFDKILTVCGESGRLLSSSELDEILGLWMKVLGSAKNWSKLTWADVEGKNLQKFEGKNAEEEPLNGGGKDIDGLIAELRKLDTKFGELGWPTVLIKYVVTSKTFGDVVELQKYLYDIMVSTGSMTYIQWKQRMVEWGRIIHPGLESSMIEVIIRDFYGGKEEKIPMNELWARMNLTEMTPEKYMGLLYKNFLERFPSLGSEYVMAIVKEYSKGGTFREAAGIITSILEGEMQRRKGGDDSGNLRNAYYKKRPLTQDFISTHATGILLCIGGGLFLTWTFKKDIIDAIVEWRIKSSVKGNFKFIPDTLDTSEIDRAVRRQDELDRVYNSKVGKGGGYGSGGYGRKNPVGRPRLSYGERNVGLLRTLISKAKLNPVQREKLDKNVDKIEDDVKDSNAGEENDESKDGKIKGDMDDVSKMIYEFDEDTRKAAEAKELRENVEKKPINGPFSFIDEVIQAPIFGGQKIRGHKKWLESNRELFKKYAKGDAEMKNYFDSLPDMYNVNDVDLSMTYGNEESYIDENDYYNDLIDNINFSVIPTWGQKQMYEYFISKAQKEKEERSKKINAGLKSGISGAVKFIGDVGSAGASAGKKIIGGISKGAGKINEEIGEAYKGIKEGKSMYPEEDVVYPGFRGVGKKIPISVRVKKEKVVNNPYLPIEEKEKKIEKKEEIIDLNKKKFKQIDVLGLKKLVDADTTDEAIEEYIENVRKKIVELRGEEENKGMTEEELINAAIDDLVEPEEDSSSEEAAKLLSHVEIPELEYYSGFMRPSTKKYTEEQAIDIIDKLINVNADMEDNDADADQSPFDFMDKIREREPKIEEIIPELVSYDSTSDEYIFSDIFYKLSDNEIFEIKNETNTDLINEYISLQGQYPKLEKALKNEKKKKFLENSLQFNVLSHAPYKKNKKYLGNAKKLNTALIDAIKRLKKEKEKEEEEKLIKKQKEDETKTGKVTEEVGKDLGGKLKAGVIEFEPQKEAPGKGSVNG